MVTSPPTRLSDRLSGFFYLGPQPLPPKRLQEAAEILKGFDTRSDILQPACFTLITNLQDEATALDANGSDPALAITPRA